VDARTEALERLYRKQYVSFRNGLAPVVGSYDDARDVVQEAFARALRSRGDFRGKGSLRAWVWRIALRVSLERRRHGHEIALDVVDPQLVESERDPELAAALRRLPPRKRVVVMRAPTASTPARATPAPTARGHPATCRVCLPIQL
jgi:RNA polymerase sigma factor (sigma-70 family)